MLKKRKKYYHVRDGMQNISRHTVLRKQKKVDPLGVKYKN